MDRLNYYKNFSMGTEIDVAGTFIYNGISEFNKMKNFCIVSEVFSFIYLTSVGMERLQKALLILLENKSIEEIEEFEKELITHSHQDLHNKIKNKSDIQLTPVQNEFLQILTQFYISCRYDRFCFNTEFEKEKTLLVSFISKHLDKKIVVDDFFCTPNDKQIKDFIGRTVGGIAKRYYDEIREQAYNLGIYTYELRSGSPAEKIFLSNFKKNSFQEQFDNEKIALKEFFVYLMNTTETSGFYQFLKSVKPLEIDIALIQEYFTEICKGIIPQQLIDEVEHLYGEMDESIGDRLSCLDVIGNNNYIFEDDFDLEDED